MLIPVIKVVDKTNGSIHIVGTDTHDKLYIDENGAMQYYNLQNGEGTRGDYEFVYKSDEYWEYIEFVTFEELEKIYKKQTEKENEWRKNRDNLFSKELIDEYLKNKK